MNITNIKDFDDYHKWKIDHNGDTYDMKDARSIHLQILINKSISKLSGKVGAKHKWLEFIHFFDRQAFENMMSHVSWDMNTLPENSSPIHFTIDATCKCGFRVDFDFYTVKKIEKSFPLILEDYVTLLSYKLSGMNGKTAVYSPKPNHPKCSKNKLVPPCPLNKNPQNSPCHLTNWQTPCHKHP